MRECAQLKQPVMLGAAEGRVVECLNIQVVIKVPSKASGGSVGMAEMLVPPGEGPPMHIHRREEEAFHVLEGSFRFWCGDRVWDGGKGATVLLPRGVPHTFQNVGDAPGRLMASVTPGGFERFFERCDEGGLRVPEDAAALRALAAEFGMEFTGPKPARAGTGRR